MIFIAHRGFRIGVAENTFQAFDKSVAQGMDFIELDVHISTDRVVHVMHDAKLDRTMQGTGPIINCTSAELSTMKSKEGNFLLPTLRSTIERYLRPPTTTIKLMIELKGEDATKYTCDLVKEFKIEDRVVFSGNDLDRFRLAQLLCPSVPLCLNITHCPAFNIDILLETESREDLPLPFSMVSLASSMIFDEEYAKICKKMGITPLTWNFNDELPHKAVKKMQQLINWGVEGVLFDDARTVKPIQNFLASM